MYLLVHLPFHRIPLPKLHVRICDLTQPPDGALKRASSPIPRPRLDRVRGVAEEVGPERYGQVEAVEVDLPGLEESELDEVEHMRDGEGADEPELMRPEDLGIMLDIPWIALTRGDTIVRILLVSPYRPPIRPFSPPIDPIHPIK